MRDQAFLLTSNPPKRGDFSRRRPALRRLPRGLAAASLTGLAVLAGCASSGSGDMGTSLGGGSSQSKPSITAPDSPTWSNTNSGGGNASGDNGSTGNTPTAALNGPVEQLKTTAVTPIVPLAAALTSGTQTLGATTGLGAPVGSVLTTLGSALSGEGRTIAAAGKGDAQVSTLGNTVSALGTLTSGLSTLVTPAAPAAGSAGTSGGTPGGALTGALGGALAPVTTAASTLGGGGIGSTVGGLAGGGLTGVTSGAHR